MGLLRNLILGDQQKKEFEESKRRYNEDMKLRKAQLEVTKANLRQNIAEAFTMLSPQNTGPKPSLLSRIQEMGISPDYTKADFSEMAGGGMPKVPVPTSLVSKLIDQEMKMGQAKPQEWKPTTNEFERVKKEESGTTRQPTEYEIWKRQQPKGVDTSLIGYKKAITEATTRDKERDWLGLYNNYLQSLTGTKISSPQILEQFLGGQPETVRKEARLALTGKETSPLEDFIGWVQTNKPQNIDWHGLETDYGKDFVKEAKAKLKTLGY